MILDAVIGGADKDYAHFLSGTMLIEILLNAWTYAIAYDEADEKYIYYSYTCTCRCLEIMARHRVTKFKLRLFPVNLRMKSNYIY